MTPGMCEEALLPGDKRRVSVQVRGTQESLS